MKPGLWTRPGPLLAAAFTLGVVIAVYFLPGYHGRLRAVTQRLVGLEQRLGLSEHEVRLSLHRADYGTIAFVRDRTFSDAVILISDDPRDGKLASLLWCAHYLYPRTLVQLDTVLEDRLEPDFVVLTPNFHPGHESPQGNDGFAIDVVSERARRHAQTTWPR